MANSDKNIVITPNISSTTADPQIVFSGADASLGPQNITLKAYPTSNGTLSFEGSAGQLFSITNSLSGTIFSVNDVSGIPSIEVLDTGIVKLAQYSGNVLLGTATDNSTNKLQVTGNVSATGTVSATTFSGALSGNATTATRLQTARTINGVSFNGTANITVTANTTNTLTRGTYLTGANFNGAAATTWAVDATTTATANKVVARDASGDDFRRYGYAQYFNMSHSVGTRNTDTIFYSSTDAFIRKNNATGFRTALSAQKKVVIQDAAPAGVASDLWWNSTTAQLYIYYNDGDSAQWVTAARGPAGPQGPLGPMGPAAILSNQTTSTATHYPTLTTVINGTATSLAVSSTKLTYQPSSGRLGATEMRATASTASSSTTTGALVVSGGAGVAGALYAGGAVRFTQNTASTSTTTGTLVVTGGIGLNGRLTASNIVAGRTLIQYDGTADIGQVNNSTMLEITDNGATSTPSIALHRPGAWATKIVLHTDNQLYFGGWSAAAGGQTIRTGTHSPGATNTYDLGTTALRWRNIYTQDLHLSNGIGDYTVIEGEEDLFLINNKSGRSFKFALIEVDPLIVPLKSDGK